MSEERYTPLRMGEPRLTSHTNDGNVPWAHPYGTHIAHSHVIEERRSISEKNALGDHIDKHHPPVSQS